MHSTGWKHILFKYEKFNVKLSSRVLVYTHLLSYTYILWPNSSQYKYAGDRQKQGRPPKFETIEYIKIFNLKYLKINKYNNQCKQTPTCLKYSSNKKNPFEGKRGAKNIKIY